MNTGRHSNVELKEEDLDIKNFETTEGYEHRVYLYRGILHRRDGPAIFHSFLVSRFYLYGQKAENDGTSKPSRIAKRSHLIYTSSYYGSPNVK